jgi:hypothetical protein
VAPPEADADFQLERKAALVPLHALEDAAGSGARVHAQTVAAGRPEPEERLAPLGRRLRGAGQLGHGVVRIAVRTGAAAWRTGSSRGTAGVTAAACLGTSCSTQ